MKIKELDNVSLAHIMQILLLEKLPDKNKLNYFHYLTDKEKIKILKDKIKLIKYIIKRIKLLNI